MRGAATLTRLDYRSNQLQPIDHLYRGATRDPGAVALAGGGTRLTYGQLVEQVDALAVAFQTADPVPGSRVGICALNTPGHLVALLATYAAGKVWVPLNPRNGRAELDRMIAAAAPGILVADESCRDRFTPTGAPLWWTGEIPALARRHAGQAPARPERAATDVQVIKFSGGSTGTPKGVLQSLRCINAQVKTIDHHFGFTAADTNLIAAPLTHGTSCFVLPILAVGGRLVLLEKPGAGAILEAFAREGVTTVYLPPTLIYSLLDEVGTQRAEFPDLRHLIYSAAPMPPDRIEATRAVFGPVLETAYGQVEAPQVVTVMRAAEFADPRNTASVGRPTFMTTVEIMSPEGQPVPRGEAGEIVIRGDLVMNGYLNDPELTARTIVDGWLHTGDLGVLDARGYLYLKGRSREVIISGGFNIFPADVETVLARHPGVQECCVFGVADPKWGEAVHAAVRLVPGASVSEAELIGFVKRELDSVKAPKAIHLVEGLPRNAAGKVSRGAVREQVLGAGHVIRD